MQQLKCDLATATCGTCHDFSSQHHLKPSLGSHSFPPYRCNQANLCIRVP